MLTNIDTKIKSMNEVLQRIVLKAAYEVMRCDMMHCVIPQLLTTTYGECNEIRS